MDKLNTLINTLSAQLQADFWRTIYFAKETGKVENTNTFIAALVELALDYYKQPQVAQIGEKGEAAVEQPTPAKKKTTKSAAKRTTTDYQAILALHAAGLANTQIAEKIGCSVRTVSRYVKKFALEATKEDNTQLAPVIEEKQEETTKPVVLEAKQEVKPVEPIRAFSAWDFSDDEEEEADTHIEPVAQLQDTQDAPFPTPEEFFELEGRAHILGMEDEGITATVCQRIADTYNGRYTINQIQGAFLRHKSGIGALSAVKQMIDKEPMVSEEAVVNRLKSQYGKAYIYRQLTAKARL